MKILHFISLTGIGGVQTQFTASFLELQKVDHRNDHIIVTKSIDQQYRLADVPIKNLNNFKDRLYILTLIILSRNILHVYNRTSSKWLRLLKLIAVRSKLILHERGNLWNAKGAQIKLSSNNCHIADMIVCNSNATAQFVRKRCGVDEGKIRIVHNGVNDYGQIIGPQFDKYQSDQIKIAFIGRIEPHKGLIYLLEAMKHLSDQHYILNIVGDGNLRKEYEIEYRKSKNINFLGRKDNIIEYLKSEIDILVIPSIREPLGNVCIEAGLAGVAVLAANVDGIPEVIQDGVSGMLINPTLELENNFREDGGGVIPEYVYDPKSGELVKPKALNPADISSALEQLSRNKHLRTQLATNLHRKVVQFFSIQHYTQQLIKIYDEV